MPKFTIFIPTYNRSKLLKRLLDSLEAQEYYDFECLIIDDGSSDGTESFIESIKELYSFPIRYYYQNNMGKPVARNKAIMLASGEFFLTVDSDDLLLPGTLQKMNSFWEEIPDEKKHCYAGVEGLCKKIGEDSYIGNEFPNYTFDSSHLETRFKLGITGDKIRFIKTSVFKSYLFPIIEGEKFIPESFVWNKIGVRYKMRYVNEIFAEIDYQSDGLTGKSILNRVNNCNSVRLYYLDFLNNILEVYKPKKKFILINMINYVRFSFHAKISLREQCNSLKKKFLYFFNLPIGFLMFIYDQRKLNKI
jgi:glycosyltransferase involved in cell wall biosynthesis